MLVIVCYDVSDDGRRLRLHKTLLAYGKPVQRSVFECDLSGPELARLRRRVQRVLGQSQDNVRFYLLCEACVSRVDAMGGSPPERRPDYYVV